MFVWLFLGEELFYVIRASSQGISSVEDLDHHIGGIDHFVQLVPDATRLTFGKLVGSGLEAREGERKKKYEVK